MALGNVVFISYARSDGEQFADELKERLKNEPDITLWQDRIRMAPGDFEQQIKQAINSAQYLVIVMTPGALRSAWVEKEWRYARENGVCVCPIRPKLQSPAEESELSELRTQLPRWMQQTQIFDFEGYWKRFVAVLQSSCQATRVPFLATPLPLNFVRRPLEFSRIIDGVLDTEHKDPSGKRVVLYGAGGFGKTTLALSVCHEESVFTACDGGVIWATLGAQPSVISELTKIYAALTGERPQFADVDDARFGVAEKLDGKRCLMVIDDVWEIQDLEPFLQGGEQCTRLITTRRFNIAVHEAEELCRINIAEMKPAEGREVLATGLKFSPATLPRFHQLADRLGDWPLILELANRTLLEQVALGDTVEDALNWAQEVYGKTSVADGVIADTIELSLSRLKQDRLRCLELAIFPEGADIPLEPIGLVWQKDITTTKALAQRMHDLALIKLNVVQKPGSASSGRSVRLHEAMRTYFAAQLSDPAILHGRLADALNDPDQTAGDYALQYVAYHLSEAMSDPGQVIQRGRQLFELLTDSRFREYRKQHGDPVAVHRQIMSALRRAAVTAETDSPALVVALAVLQKSYSVADREPKLIFDIASEGRIREAEQRLELFGMEPEWNTLARLIIAWVGASHRPAEANSLLDLSAASCNRPELRTVFEWVREAPDGRPAGLPPISGRPHHAYVSGILRRAGGAETSQGLEPVDHTHLASGLTGDSSSFIADRDGPDLVAFAALDPAANTQYLERYIEIHAANRYRYYRNRSLWALLKSVVVYPESAWVQSIVQKIVIAALTVTHVDFEEFLPLAVRGLQARAGDQSAARELEIFKQRLYAEVAGLGTGASTGGVQSENLPTDLWSHYLRRVCALAEVYALALDSTAEAATLLQLARQLPKGFAGFRVFSALMLAESTELALAGDRPAIDAALTSALAASHRIQDYPFCLRATAMVNAMRSRWWGPGMDVEASVENLLKDPLTADFCAVHRVLEEFEFRDDPLFQSLAIPEPVLKADRLSKIAEVYRLKPEQLLAVNPSISDGIDQPLGKNDEVNIPEPDFIPILAARFAAEAIVSPALPDERRTTLIQRLVPLTLSNRTALDTVLARLLLSARKTMFDLPESLATIEVPGAPASVDSSSGIGFELEQLGKKRDHESRDRLVEEIHQLMESREYAKAIKLSKAGLQQFPADLEVGDLKSLAEQAVERIRESKRLLEEDRNRDKLALEAEQKELQENPDIHQMAAVPERSGVIRAKYPDDPDMQQTAAETEEAVKRLGGIEDLSQPGARGGFASHGSGEGAAAGSNGGLQVEGPPSEFEEVCQSTVQAMLPKPVERSKGRWHRVLRGVTVVLILMAGFLLAWRYFLSTHAHHGLRLAPVTLSRVQILLDPSDSALTIDGRPTAERILSLPANRNIRVEVSRLGYQTQVQQLKPSSEWRISLQPEPLHLSVQTPAIGGTVLLDGKEIRRVPGATITDYQLVPDAQKHKLSMFSQGEQLFAIQFAALPGARPRVSAVQGKDLLVVTSLGSGATAYSSSPVSDLWLGDEQVVNLTNTGVDLPPISDQKRELRYGEGEERGRASLEVANAPQLLARTISSDGQVLITSNVGVANLAVDGQVVKRQGHTWQISRPPGTYNFVLSAEGYKSQNWTVKLQKGQIVSRTVILSVEGPTSASLIIEGGTPNAEVYLDGRKIGELDKEGRKEFPGVLNNLPHSVQMQKAGFESWHQNIPAKQLATELRIQGRKLPVQSGALAFRDAPPKVTLRYRAVNQSEVHEASPASSVSVEPGTYEIVAEAPGYETLRKNVEVFSGRATSVDLRLARIVSGIELFQDAGAVIAEGEWFRPKNKSATIYLKPGLLRIRLTFIKPNSNLFQRKKIQWVVESGDGKRRVQYELNNQKITRKVMEGEEASDRLEIKPSLASSPQKDQFAIVVQVNGNNIRIISEKGELLDDYVSNNEDYSQGRLGVKTDAQFTVRQN